MNVQVSKKDLTQRPRRRRNKSTSRFNLVPPNTTAIEHVLTFHVLYRHLLYRHWIIPKSNTALTRPTVSFGRDAETLERALTGDTLQLFQDFEEDKPEEAAKLKVQLLQMVKTGFVKKDEPFTVEQMTRMISGMSSNGSSNAAKARIARNRRNAFDSEDDESDSDLM